MSVRNHLYRNAAALVILLAMLPGGIFTSSVAWAQRRGRRDSQPTETAPSPSRKNERGPRAVAVVEWQTDARGRATPKLVPVVILDGGKLYDASLYRATPVPMALESGTVYEAQDAGEILGYFTIKGAARVNTPATTTADSDSVTDERPWIGVGDWKTVAPPLDLYSNRPQHAEVVKPGQASGENNGPSASTGSTRQKSTVYNEQGKEEPQDPNDRPTLKTRSKEKEGTPRVAPPEAKKTNPDDDPDRPRLKRQPASDSGTSGQPAPASSSASSASPSSGGDAQPSVAATGAGSSSSAGADSDRPVLRRGVGGEQVKRDSAEMTNDRPALKPGRSESGSSRSAPSDRRSGTKTALAPTVPQRVIDRGTREPDENRSVSLRTRTYEAVAVSDANVPANPPMYKHRWVGDEESEVTRKITTLAESEVQNFLREQGYGAPLERTSTTRTTPRVQRRPGSSSSGGSTVSSSGAQSADAKPKLEDVRVFALDISSNNSSEIVLTGRQRQAGSRSVYIALVARMDLTGNPRKLFASVTSSDRLDSIPRLEFIDAVDVDGDGRAELLFRAVGSGYAEFDVYRVGPDKLTEIFHGGEA